VQDPATLLLALLPEVLYRPEVVKGRLHYMSTDLDQLDMGWDVVSGCEWMLIQQAKFQEYLRRRGLSDGLANL
jgi:hypothetical protein